VGWGGNYPHTDEIDILDATARERDDTGKPSYHCHYMATLKLCHSPNICVEAWGHHVDLQGGTGNGEAVPQGIVKPRVNQQTITLYDIMLPPQTSLIKSS